jgi:hypothetical protein
MGSINLFCNSNAYLLDRWILDGQEKNLHEGLIDQSNSGSSV